MDERQSFGKTVMALFLAPGQAFDHLLENATWRDWVYPLIVVSLLLSLVPLSYRSISLYEAQTRLESMEKKIMSNPDIPEQQKVKIQERFDKGREHIRAAKETPWAFKQLIGYLLIPVTLMVLSALFAIILWMVGNFGMGGQVRFTQLFAAVLLSYLIGGSGMFFNMSQGIGSLELILKAPLILIKEGTDVTFSLGLLFDSLDNWFKVFLNQIEVFRVWAVVVLGMGFARLYRKSMGTGIVSVSLVWLVLTAIGAFLMRLNGMAAG